MPLAPTAQPSWALMNRRCRSRRSPPLPAACRVSEATPVDRAQHMTGRADRRGSVGIEGIDGRGRPFQDAGPAVCALQLWPPSLVWMMQAGISDAAADKPVTLVIAEAERDPACGVGGEERRGYVDCRPRGAAVIAS